jgi:uncharacterized membrane protein
LPALFVSTSRKPKLVPEASEENAMQAKFKSAQLALFTLVLALPSSAQQSTMPGRMLGAFRPSNQPSQIGMDHGISTPKPLPSTALTAPTFTFGMLDFPGATTSYILGTGDKSHIVGAYGPLASSSSPSWNGYRLSGTDFTKITFPGAVHTFAAGINTAGTIVGAYELSDGSFHGYLLTANTFSKFDYPGSANTEPTSINDSGEIVGYWWNDINFLNSFVYSNGVFTSLQPPGSTFTLAQHINKAGDIVGQFYDSANAGHGFLLHSGSYTVDYPGATSTSLEGINNKGQIVGAYGTGEFVQGFDLYHGFLDDGGTFTSFDVPLAGAPLTIPRSINDKGQIAGFYTDTTSTYFGFVASFK